MIKSSSKKMRKIRKEMLKLAKDMPYNLCDRWCEKCPTDIRNTCKVYNSIFEKDLKTIAQGKNPQNHAQVIQDISDNLAEAFNMIEEENKKRNLTPDISKIKNPKSVFNTQLFKLATEFVHKTKAMEKFYQEDNPDPQYQDAFETIFYYMPMIHTKSARIMSNILNRDPKDKRDYFYISDSMIQMEIIKIAITRLLSAYRTVSQLDPSTYPEIYALLDVIEKITHKFIDLEIGFEQDLERIKV